MSRGDVLGLVLSYVYAFGLLFAVEAVGRRLMWQQRVTRKIIHIGAGLWVWGILALFDHWYLGIIPFATFIVLNYVFYRWQSFKAMDTTDSTPGTVYFALSITVLFVLLWRTGGVVDRVPIAAAATMAMTLGDATASLVGQRWGKHRYAFFGHTRTWEGTTAMAAVTWLSVAATLLWLPGSALSPNSIPWTVGEVWLVSLLGTIVAATAEAISPAGTDNLSVPVLSGFAMFVVGRVLAEVSAAALSVRFVVGLGLSGVVGLVAYQRKSLTPSGVFGAVLIGTTIFFGGGWAWGLVLITFFVLSSMLSHYKATIKEHLAAKFAKGGRRDLGQAVANGGAGALIAVAYLLYPEPVLWAAFVGAIATVNADTWATELGVLSKRSPRLVTTWETVEAGTSGGISLLGTLATLAGALSIGLAAMVYIAIDGSLGGSANAALGSDGVLGGMLLIPSAALGGLVGSLFDSLLGATVQAIYYSTARQKETERRIDPDGTPNDHVRGWRWLGNDGVNFGSSLVGAMVGALVWMWAF
jgi:uncharacterized protein (TIGR00297 family)